MGKCSGLKGGGHHRRAVDVAEKKKNEKANRKKEQAASGKRAFVLHEILTNLDPDCDLYLDAALCNRHQQTKTTPRDVLPDLCRAHFRHYCTNKRCKFSHKHSVSEALSNATSGGESKNNNNNINNTIFENGPSTLPALKHLPGMLRDTTPKGKKRRPRRPLRGSNGNSDPHNDGNGDRTTTRLSLPATLETALSEGSSAIDTIVSCLDSDRDVVSLGMASLHLCGLVLEGGTHRRGCPDVRRRKFRCLERKLRRRNELLLGSKGLAGGLRYAVGYFETTNHNQSKKKSKTKTNNPKQQRKPNTGNGNSNSNTPQKSGLRPVLVFDYENPSVYKAFQESGFRNKTTTHNHFGLGPVSSSLAKDCTLNP